MGIKYNLEDWEKMIDGTKSAEQIAKEYKISRCHVYYIARKYNLPLVKVLSSDYHGIPKEVLENDLKNMTVNDVANKYGFSTATLKNWCTVRGIEYHTVKRIVKTEIKHVRKRTGESIDMIKYLMNEFTDASIARVFGYSKERIRQIRKEIGLTKYKESE